MTVHAPIAPSSLALIVACNASMQLQMQVPPLPETDEEAEGTAWHLCGLAHAQGNPWPVGHKFQSSGKQFEIDDEMHRGAVLWASTMRKGSKGGLRLEDGVKASDIHPDHCWGTPDGWEYFPAGTGPREVPVLRVGDYKGGHRFIDEFENWQLIAYAIGVMERLQLSDEHLILELIVVQPRAYRPGETAVRVWRVPAIEIRALVNIAAAAAHAALAPNPIATTGHHCIDCKARHVCKTLRASTANLVDYSGTAELQPLDPVAMGQELRIIRMALKRLEARETGLAAAVEAALRSGQSVPFFGMKPKQTKLMWRDGVSLDEVRALGEMLGISLLKAPAIITPTQAKDAGVDEAIVLEYAHRPPGAMALAEDDPRAVRKIVSKSRYRTHG